MFRDTHESKSDPEARMYHKNRWTPGQPSYLGHVVTENKHGLIVQSCVTEAIKRAEREAGLMMQTFPAASIRTTWWALFSATYTFPFASDTTADGMFSEAVSAGRPFGEPPSNVPRID